MMKTVKSEKPYQVVAVDPLSSICECQNRPQNLEYMASGGGATELYVLRILG
jgi:hypothetical protein